MATEITNKPRTGRRKKAVARVQLLPGNGKHVVNDRTPLEYLTRETLVQTAFHALTVVNAAGQVRRGGAGARRRAHGPGRRAPPRRWRGRWCARTRACAACWDAQAC